MNNKIIDLLVEWSHAVHCFTVYISHQCSNQIKQMTSLHFQSAHLTFSTDCQTRRCQFIFVSIYPAWELSQIGQNKISRNWTAKTNKTKENQYDRYVEKWICKRKMVHRNIPQSWSELNWTLEKRNKKKIRPKVNNRLKNTIHHVICKM